MDDFESDWEFKKPFDFITARNIAGASRDFPGLLQRMKNNLKNGGYVELVNFVADISSDDNTISNAPNVVKWCELLDEASIKFGKQLNIAPKYKQWMIDAGFKNVTEEVYKVLLPLSYAAISNTAFYLGSCEPLGQGSSLQGDGALPSS